ncbi:MAG: peptidoglycan-associated lipoprotein Pal [Gemmatimonadaceae bacterium]|nr:peptidoglycan-associated lipoprotein Pal [Gemmatimonadaceae bacterium]MCW5825454.1 peptidoglycan-associated lipoprotein Pal [Gemmatimonadaceae bacterium]
MNARLPMLAALATTVVVLSACPSPPPPPPPAPVVNQDSIDAANRRAAEEAERARREAEERARREAEERARREAEERAARERAAALAAARAAFATAIYFDYDRAELKPEARATLDAKLPLLRANSQVRIRIAGHTDERGSDAYNIALGQRRAAAAKAYLVANGIAADRIDVVSFGEDRPAAMGSNEAAWAQNRRDEFEIIVGGESLRLP